MGTRSITYVYDKSGNILVKMYLQFDGYPGGHGYDLAKFLKKSYVKKQERIRMEKISANLVCEFFKTQPRYALLISPFDNSTYYEDWAYHIYSGFVKISDLHKDKEYEANWKNDDFENLCFKLNFGEDNKEEHIDSY